MEEVAGLGLGFTSDGEDSPIAGIEARGSPWVDAARRAEEALRRKWEREQPEVPERPMCFTVTLHCTFAEWQEVQLALKGLCPNRKWFRQEEIDKTGRKVVGCRGGPGTGPGPAPGTNQG